MDALTDCEEPRGEFDGLRSMLKSFQGEREKKSDHELYNEYLDDIADDDGSSDIDIELNYNDPIHIDSPSEEQKEQQSVSQEIFDEWPGTDNESNGNHETQPSATSAVLGHFRVLSSSITSLITSSKNTISPPIEDGKSSYRYLKKIFFDEKPSEKQNIEDDEASKLDVIQSEPSKPSMEAPRPMMEYMEGDEDEKAEIEYVGMTARNSESLSEDVCSSLCVY